ncbi:hypothetical protein ACFWWM_25910 [Streptomyces sp. NPDC058682]|uniref:hypothetical protein n=1 Tax=Streptomyces sp. NPDC058682 TaxID=3346596 RepID=UPI00364CDC0E
MDDSFEDGFRTGLLIGCGAAVVSAAVALLIRTVGTAADDPEEAWGPGGLGTGPRLNGLFVPAVSPRG